MKKVKKNNFIELNKDRMLFVVVVLFILSFIMSFVMMSIMTGFHFLKSFLRDYLSVSFIVFFFIVTTYIYIRSVKIKLNKNKVSKANSPISMLFFVAFLGLILDVVISKHISVFAIPFLMPTLLLIMLTDKNYANICNVLIAALYTVIYLFTNESLSISETIYNVVFINFQLISGMITIAILDTTKTRVKQTTILLFIGFAMFATNVILHVFRGENVIKTILDNFWIILGTIMSIAIYYLLLPFMEAFFKVCTDAKLLEYCDDNYPLLKLLKEKAPGTYNHCIMVANLAEVAASAIGENTLMARVAAYYHDVGKIANPKYFAENITDSINPHEELIPEVSASLIIKHAEKGYDLMKEYGMPESIANVALEHHGNAIVQYFYNKAQNISERIIDTKNYRYPNHRPTTKISAIIMIVDTIEAATRANIGSMDYDQLRKFIKKLIKEKIDDNQLEYCDITLAEINKIKDTIIDYLPGMYHKRVKYDNKINK